MGGHKEIVEILITEGAEVNAKEEDGRTPLDWAKGERRRGPLRHPETADHLGKHGGKTWKELEAAGKPPEPVAKVVSQSTPAPPTEEKPAEPVTEATQPKPPTTKTPDVSLWDAAMFGKIEAAKKAIADGANVNAKKDDGETPLHWATVEAMDSGSKKVIELLISKGADVNAKIVAGRKKGMTPLAIANMFSNKEIADFLRKHGGKTRKELKAEGK